MIKNVTFRFFCGRVAQRRGLETAALENYRAAWETSDRTDPELAYRLGQAALRVENLNLAAEAFIAASELRPNNSHSWYKLGYTLERDKVYTDALDAYHRAIALEPADPKLAFRSGRCYQHLGLAEPAIASFHASIRGRFQEAESYAAIYSLEGQLPAWKRLQTLYSGRPHRPHDQRWALDIAQLELFMCHYVEAATAYEHAEELGTLSERDRVDYAIALLESGQQSVARKVLSTVAAESDKDVRELGPGMLMVQRGRWRDAIRLFEQQLGSTVTRALRGRLSFQIAHAYDRQYLLHDAAAWFRRSLEEEGHTPYWHYRLGVTLERLELFEEAAAAYSYALSTEPGRRHWWYRLGETFTALGKHVPAVDAYMRSMGNTSWAPPIKVPTTVETTHKSTPQDEIDADESSGPPEYVPEYEHLAKQYLRTAVEKRVASHPTDPESWAELASLSDLTPERARYAALQELQRNPELSARKRIHAAELLIDDGKYSNAIAALRGSRKFARPDGLDLKRYTSTPKKKRLALFAEVQTEYPLASRTVLLESNHGASIGCHPLALFREMSVDPRFNDFTYVWVYTALAAIPDEISSRDDVLLVELHSDAYIHHLATAEYLINNVSFAPYFVRRPGQKYLNTWHGTPLKTLGRSMKQGLLEYENLARNFIQSSHLIAPNDLTRWALVEDHGIDAYYDGVIEVTGSPRLDRLVRDGHKLRTEIRRRLGVSPEERLVLFAPTWRGSVATQKFDEDALLQDLRALSGTDGVRPFYRAHRLTEKFVRELPIPVDVVPPDIDTNDLLAAVDILVSDYSSIVFDFLPTGRRIILYTPDEEQYVSERGLYLDLDELPCTVCCDRDQLQEALAVPDDPVSPEEYSEAVKRFAPMEDGNASQRVLNMMLSDHRQQDARPLIVFHASLIANGIAAAFVALLSALSPDQYRVVLIVEANVVRGDEGRQLYMSRLPKHVNLAFRIGSITATPEEQWAVNRRNDNDIAPSSALADLSDRAWSREARRILGGVKVSAAVEFDGYAKLWADLMSAVGGKATKHLIWQHNQLVDEARAKYPELYDVFRKYDKFDEITAVAHSLSQENRAKLEALGYTDTPVIATIPNVLPVERIRALAEEAAPTDIHRWMEATNLNVVAIGRLSPEKNFRSLIQAWPYVRSHHPRARLTILGDGLERAELETTAYSLGVADSIFFYGQVENPYPIIRRADLFVLPSTHEGQPVVLFEAMTLGAPVACCFTPGSAEAIATGYGQIIDPTPDTMAKDIVALLTDRTPATGTFDADVHRERAIKTFHERLTAENNR